ncbi:hypothetical protein, partial [Staphylococcus aureus]|uniref:hypothetical protein n=1 Tax=Staphylococcus aureus TaxID=1280 RepID=UPI0039BE1CB3
MPKATPAKVETKILKRTAESGKANVHVMVENEVIAKYTPPTINAPKAMPIIPPRNVSKTD